MCIDISVLVPIHNEAEAIPSLVAALNSFFKNSPDLKGQVVFIDDGSSDGSVELLRHLDHQNYQATLIRLSKNYGSHNALRAGLGYSRGEYITFAFADLQEPLDLLVSMREQCLSGSDIVWANRERYHHFSMEWISSRVYAVLMRWLVSKDFPDSGFGTVMFGQQVCSVLVAMPEGHSSLYLQIFTLGFRQKTIFYRRQKRKHGRSKWTFSKKIKILIDSLIGFSYIPIQAVSAVGFFLTLFGWSWAVYVVARRLILGDIIQGWAALLAVLMVGFGVTNVSLGIIAAYLWRTLDASRSRPAFLIREVQHLEGSEK